MDTELDNLPDVSEQLDQLQADQTLVDRGVPDVLDEGFSAPDHWSGAQGFGSTAAEMRQGEPMDLKLSQEEPQPDPAAPRPTWRDDPHEKREVGGRRAGRLVDAKTDTQDVVAEDVGIDGGAASAEEAAMHIIDPDREDEDDDD